MGLPWRNLGDDLLKKNANNSGIHVIILTSTNTKYYNGKLCLSSSLPTLILAAPDIKEFKYEVSEQDPTLL
nr:hypothetical protein [Tanacetum cinerariifolium]